MSRPTIEQVTRIFETREVGARLGEGAWDQLPEGRWSIPAVTYMFRSPRPPVVLEPDGRRGWKVARGHTQPPENLDPLSASKDVRIV